MLGLIKNEFYKQKGNWIILLILAIPIGVSFLLGIDLLIRYRDYLLPLYSQEGLTSWQILINEQRILFFNDFMPLFAALILTVFFECEYKGNSWNFLLTKPIKREYIIFSKYISALIIFIIMLAINILALVVVGKIFKFSEPIPWKFFLIMAGIQLLAGIVIMTIHLFISLKNKNLMISIGIAGVLSIISSNLYYNGAAISKVNLYGLSFFSITQSKTEIITVLVSAVLIYSIGNIAITKYFNNKKIY